MNKSKFNKAILLIIFNRPEKANKVFESIRLIKPSRLYIACDGPRFGFPKDIELVNESRSISSKIDWDCDLKTLYRPKNLGCQFGPKLAIDWFFKNEEMGIILEDDCLPNSSFYYFCNQLLDKYYNTKNVMAIAGTNIYPFKNEVDDYYFSKYPLMWGWASWRRAWLHYDSSLSDWDRLKQINWLNSIPGTNFPFRQLWMKTFDLTKSQGVNASWWDYQWIYSCWKANGLVIVPSKNLVTNIGHSEDATHTFIENPLVSNLKLENLTFPLKHPKIFEINSEADSYIGKVWFCETWTNYIKVTIKRIPFFYCIYKLVKKSILFLFNSLKIKIF